MDYECQNFKNGQVLTAECLNKIDKALEECCKHSVTDTPQDWTEEQQKQVRENIGINTGVNRHAKYFTITEDGVLSLKPEYRGACYGAIEFVRGMDVTNGYFYVDKLGPGSILYQCVRTSSSSAVAAEGYPQSLEQTYYFTRVSNYENKVSDNGAGMAGSKSYELPTLLYVPEMVGSITSTALEPMAFDHNQAIKEIVLPSTVASIPEQCFFGCQQLVNVHNTDHITSIGMLSFSRCVAIKRIFLPSLEYAEEQAFRSCVLLEYAHIGKVTELSDNLFRGCYELKKIEHDSSCKVTGVGKGACTATYKLRDADFIKDVTFMDIGAFFKSGINYDWGSLDNCEFAQKTVSESKTYETYPTSLQLNPVDFWSDCTPSACHNPTPTHFCQLDPRWINRWVGNIEETGVAYGNGCALFTFIHAYCGLNGLALSSVAEFEGIVNKLVDNDPSIWTEYQSVRSGTGIKEWGERLGLFVTEYYEYNTSTLQKLYESLFNGNYAYAVIPTYTTRRGTLEVNPGGHAACITGVTEDGRLMVIDSNELYPEDMTVGNKYSALYQSSFYPSSDGYPKPQFCIISKPIEYSRYATIEDALAETNEVTDGVVGAYYDKYGKYHVALLGDIESATLIEIERNCTFHLDGYTLTFTAPGAYLNMFTAKEVIIDGTVVREDTQSDGTVVFHKGTIKKDGITNTTDNEYLIKTTGTNLTVYGGVYSITNITTPAKKYARAIVAGVSDHIAKIKLNDCSIIAIALEETKAYCVQADSVVMNNCVATTTTEDIDSIVMSVYVDAVIKNSTLTAEATGEGLARCVNTADGCSKCDISNTTARATVNGYNTDNSNSVIGVFVHGLNVNITDCDIVVNRVGVDESDYTEEPTTKAIEIHVGGGSVTLNGTNNLVPAYP